MKLKINDNSFHFIKNSIIRSILYKYKNFQNSNLSIQTIHIALDLHNLPYKIGCCFLYVAKSSFIIAYMIQIYKQNKNLPLRILYIQTKNEQHFCLLWSKFNCALKKRCINSSCTSHIICPETEVVIPTTYMYTDESENMTLKKILSS